MTSSTPARPGDDAAPRPFLLVQTRPEGDAAAAEEESVRRLGGYPGDRLRVMRLDRRVVAVGADRSVDDATDGAAALAGAELGDDVEAEAASGVVDWNAELADVAGVILPGSPFTGSDPEESKSDLQRAVEAELGRLMALVIERQTPFLGCCYGVGTLGRAAGGVVDTTYRELPGPIPVTLTEAGAADPLLKGMPGEFTAYVGHKEAVRELPPGAVLLATGRACPVQMFRVGEHLYATQFHPELDQAGLLQRLEIYADHGYFSADEADAMFAAIRSAATPFAPLILENFCRVYG
ncbi:glutamine amidotransferase [Micrococcus lacusdianchii]|uniref:glutamine amidotransferase n=1 Tax=Micrococcus lacusdianchii TaxID=2915940 RepID=UPI0020061442|nr:glutamine amidotransferase [Micrococcus sp. JXJ CY 30]